MGDWSSNDGDEVHWTGFELGALFMSLLVALGTRMALERYGRGTLPWFRSTKPYVENGSGRLTA